MLKLPTDTLRIPINLKSYLKDPLHIGQKKIYEIEKMKIIF